MLCRGVGFSRPACDLDSCECVSEPPRRALCSVCSCAPVARPLFRSSEVKCEIRTVTYRLQPEGSGIRCRALSVSPFPYFGNALTAVLFWRAKPKAVVSVTRTRFLRVWPPVRVGPDTRQHE
eukprot:7383095-Prymnesium_polylepis.1